MGDDVRSSLPDAAGRPDAPLWLLPLSPDAMMVRKQPLRSRCGRACASASGKEGGLKPSEGRLTSKQMRSLIPLTMGARPQRNAAGGKHGKTTTLPPFQHNERVSE